MSWPQKREGFLRVLRAALLAAGLLFLWIELILWFLNLRRNEGEVAAVILVVLGAVPLAGLRNIRTRHRERQIQREAERWLLDRQAGRSRRTTPWTARLLLTLPSILALLFFLFEPEMIGMWQHLLHPGPLKIGQYRIATPVTSILLSLPDWEHPEQQWIMNEEGIARMGRHPYMALGRSLWYMGFSTTAPLEAHPLSARRFPEFLETRRAAVADREFICHDLQYNGLHFHPVTIACSGADDSFHIHFQADAKRVRDFYEFLQRNVWLEKH